MSRAHRPDLLLGFLATICRPVCFDQTAIEHLPFHYIIEESINKSNQGRDLVYLLFLNTIGLLSDGETMTMLSFLIVYSIVVIDRLAEALGY
jgi:hypothetical protein